MYYPIHGTLENEIIFGYGNDIDNSYHLIKEFGDDKFLHHFKTHKYLLNPIFQSIHSNLLQTKKLFEVHVFGHSLGLTDKTLLQEIFNSPNCKKNPSLQKI
ncbi:AbiH family protein [Thalassobellus suaedae]|uniref:AbiH family protein n=1 Tax=Thalassobellus suaedae TaxID=3074124 RepID=UPI0039F5A145